MIKRLVKLRKTLKSVPDSTYGGEEIIKGINRKIGKQVDRLVNARGKGIRFVRVNGRVIPVRRR